VRLLIIKSRWHSQRASKFWLIYQIVFNMFWLIICYKKFLCISLICTSQIGANLVCFCSTKAPNHLECKLKYDIFRLGDPVFVRDKWRALQVDGWGGFVLKENSNWSRRLWRNDIRLVPRICPVVLNLIKSG
jgi:hypothetical protein